MMKGLAAVLAVAVVAMLPAAAPAAERSHFDDPYSIMAPEPWLAPKYRSPRGLPQKPNTAKPARPRPVPPPTVAGPAPPVVLPNGRGVPNLPPVRQGIVPDGSRETFGDRAARCAHQSGLYGIQPGQQPTYMHSCTMQ